MLVFAEQRDDKFKKPSLEAISEGRRLADKLGADLTVILIGDGLAGLESEPRRLGADRILLVKEPRLRFYAPEAYARALEEAIRSVDADLVLMAASAMGRDLGARIAARFRTGLASDCTGIMVEGGALTMRRPVYSGKAFATVTVSGARPAMATLRPNVFAVLSE
ncbi:MAG TPA: electron transfer flavoprotein subunit alpha, partial [Patescibacteria group bacterium]|nr:electron transfer flavoprotein subunit alpha [Patescibacteria group bacterium]